MNDVVKVLLDRAAKETNATHAMKFTQAAVNAANAVVADLFAQEKQRELQKQDDFEKGSLRG